MVLNFTHQEDFSIYEHYHFPIQTTNRDHAIEKFGEIQQAIIEILNQRYHLHINLQNWLDKKHDEVAWFLSETSSNIFSESQEKVVSKVSLYLKENNFIIALHQCSPFNPLIIAKENIHHNQGKGFEFYKTCKGTIFFDDPTSAKKIHFKSKPTSQLL